MVKTDFVITTGDGKTYTPYWVNAKKEKEFNVSQFQFKGVKGSLVKRGQPLGRVYEIEIIFQGADNLTTAKAFDDSSDNPKAWKIAHPMYGSLYVQVTRLFFDNSQFNISRITGMIVETILDNGLAPKLNPVDVVTSQAVTTNKALRDSFVAGAPEPSTNLLNAVLTNVNGFYKAVYTKIANVQADVTAYNNIYNEVNSTILTAISLPENVSLNVIQQTQALILAPAYFANRVAERIDMYNAMLGVINGDVANILATYSRPTKEAKKLFENNGGSMITGMLLSAVTNIVSSS